MVNKELLDKWKQIKKNKDYKDLLDNTIINERALKEDNLLDDERLIKLLQKLGITIECNFLDCEIDFHVRNNAGSIYREGITNLDYFEWENYSLREFFDYILGIQKEGED